MVISKINLYCLLLVTLINFNYIINGNKILLGISLTITSIALCYITKQIKELFYLFSLIAFINTNIAINIFIFNNELIPSWQKLGLLSSPTNIDTGNSILLMMYILTIFISASLSKYQIISKLAKDETEYNPYIMVVLMISLIFIILFAFITQVYSRKNGYSSVTNPLFEYSCILMVFTYFNSKKYEKMAKKFLIIYSTVFSILFLYIGDRSSVCIIIMTLFTIYFKNKLKIKYAILLFILSVLSINFIGITRNGNVDNLIYKIIERGLYVDTITWAYYASISISSLYEYLSNSWMFAIGYLISFLTGYSNGYTNMGAYAANNFSSLYNQGGGIYSSYFYGMGGYSFVLLGSIILSIIINTIFSSKSKYANIYRILLVSLSFRWYLYNISTLFRGCIVITTFLLILSHVFTKIIRK